MKSLIRLLLIVFLALAPLLSRSQWSTVRFDSTNAFTLVEAVTANDVFVIGEEPWQGHKFLLRTSDGGLTWDSLAVGAPTDAFDLTELQFTDAANGFVGGVRVGGTQALLKSVDNGNTWSEITPQPFSTDGVSALRFRDALYGLVASDTTLHRTADGGTTWTSAAMVFRPLDISYAAADTVFACGTNQYDRAIIAKSTDGGAAWSTVLDVNNAMLFVSRFHLLQALNPDTVFASMQYSNKLMRTLDGGISWGVVTCDSVLHIVDFHFDDRNTGYVLSGTSQIFFTDDGGLTWTLDHAAQTGDFGPLGLWLSIDFAEGVGYLSGTNGVIERNGVTPNNAPIVRPIDAITVYPNPSNGPVRFDFGDLSGTLSVFNPLGQVVERARVTRSHSSRALPDGLLTYRFVTDAGALYSGKVVVQR